MATANNVTVIESVTVIDTITVTPIYCFDGVSRNYIRSLVHCLLLLSLYVCTLKGILLF